MPVQLLRRKTWPGEACPRSTMRGRVTRRGQRGFTLVELMITVAVAAVLLVIAIPSFKNILLANELDTAANGLVGAIQVTRMEAIKHNTSAQFCSNSTTANGSDTLGAACGIETGAVWALSNSTASQIRVGVAGLTSPIQISGNVTALQFSAQGLAHAVGSSGLYGGTVADICTSQTSVNNHRVINMTGGSILSTTTSSGTCP